MGYDYATFPPYPIPEDLPDEIFDSEECRSAVAGLEHMYPCFRTELSTPSGGEALSPSGGTELLTTSGRTEDLSSTGDTERLSVDNNVISHRTENTPVFPSPSTVTSPPSLIHALPKNLDEYPNVDSEFGLDMTVYPTKESDWFYEEETGKVYIKQHGILTTKFSFPVGNHNLQNLNLRAMIVNTTPDYMHEPIKRCDKHRRECEDPQVKSEHILKCHSNSVQYLGDEFSESFGERLSVVVKLATLATLRSWNGDIYVTMNWSFICFTSCAEGVKNKSTAVIFTLENDTEIVGKKVMPFLVRSKPKNGEGRDNKPADKGDSNLRKRFAGTGAPPGGKVFINEGRATSATSTLASTRPYVVNISTWDFETAEHTLVCARNSVAAALTRDPNNPRNLVSMIQIKENLRSVTSQHDTMNQASHTS